MANFCQYFLCTVLKVDALGAFSIGTFGSMEILNKEASLDSRVMIHKVIIMPIFKGVCSTLILAFHFIPQRVLVADELNRRDSYWRDRKHTASRCGKGLANCE